LASTSVFAQKQAANWFFGWNAGLDFNSGSPVALTNGQLHHYEGCSSASDSSGNLLFYTDGITIYNKNHQPMQNGTGLLGHNSSTQSALIVADPGDFSQYYVFTTDVQGGSNGLRYSIVDMNLDSGLGGIIPSMKNILLETPVTEKLAAVMHKNQQAVWVIAHRVNSNEFIAYLVTENGVSNSPVVSATGEIHTNGEGTLGYLKVSPNGEKIACARFTQNTNGGLDLFDFDTSTGIVSNPQELNYYHNMYGVEFSPNSKVLYCTHDQNVNIEGVYQYDITLPDTQSIRNSETMISNGLYFALQLGIDGKIYVANYGSSISVIQDPNSLGANCDFQHHAVSLGTEQCVYGLPNFVSTYFLMDKTLYVCEENNVVLSSRFSNANNYTWYEYDTSTNNYINISGANSATLTITDNGLYKVVTDSGTEETFTVIFSQNPVVDLGADKIFCGNAVALNGTIKNPNHFGNVTYTWYFENNIVSGETQPTFTATQSGTYSVEVIGEILDENGNPSGFFCSTTDEIEITNFTVNLGNDKMLCDENSYILDPVIVGGNETNATYLWNTGETTPTISISQNGTYSVTVTIDNCTESDSVEIIFNESPEFDLGSDVETCDITALNLVLDATPSNIPVSKTNFEWSFNGTVLPLETGPTLLVDEFGIYSVTAYMNDPTCAKTEEFVIAEKASPVVSILINDRDNLFCVGETVVLQAQLENATADEVDFTWYRENVEIAGEESAKLVLQILQNMPLTDFRVEARVNECFAKSQISIGSYDYDCTIPQGISPNGDPFNQNLDLSFLKVEELKIFNRYGRLVFHKENGYTNQWEGQTENGDKLPTATYFYVIKLEEGEVFNSQNTIAGWVYINR
jgi:gliding motility-associated-like protein